MSVRKYGVRRQGLAAAVIAVLALALTAPASSAAPAKGPKVGDKCASEGALSGTGLAQLECVKQGLILKSLKWAKPKKVEITFQSLAYQEPTVAAVNNIIASWNAANPYTQVKLVQGDWGSVQDKLVTQFQGGTAPDVIHYEASAIQGFAGQGYLADISKYLAPYKKELASGVVKAVSSKDGEKIYGAPLILQSYCVFANTDAFKAAGVAVPTATSKLTWDNFAQIAKQLTKTNQYGVGWGLKSPTATVMSLSLNFDGTYFATRPDGRTTFTFGPNEKQAVSRIYNMAYTDKSIDPVTLTQSGSAVVPGFYAGKYAMMVGGSFLAGQIGKEAPAGFNWTVLPLLSGTSANQAGNPQTLSVSAQSKNVSRAGNFVAYFMKAQNLAAFAKGDSLIPTTTSARTELKKLTNSPAWAQLLDDAPNLIKAPFVDVLLYQQFKDQIATPSFQQYIQGKITLDELEKKLTDGWKAVGY